MTDRAAEMSTLACARTAGFLYLILIVCGPFSMMYVPFTLVVPGDAAATADNIASSEWLFRLSLASDAIIFLTEIVLTAVLYLLFKPVSRIISLSAAFSRLAMAVIQGANLYFNLTALALLSGAGYLAAFETDQLHALALLFLNAHTYGAQIWGAFFGLHLVLIGYLLFKSGYFPRLLGALVASSGLGYLTNSFATFLSLDYGTIVTVIVVTAITVGELSFVFWLLFKGVNVKR